MVKGIRQGDPVSSFLFTIVSKSLTYIVHKAQQQELIDGIKIGSHEVNLTHLQFASDILIFLPKYTKKVVNYRRLLNCLSHDITGDKLQ